MMENTMQTTIETRTFQQVKANRTKARSFILSKINNSYISGSDRDSKVLDYLLKITSHYNTTLYTGTDRNIAIQVNLSESSVKKTFRELKNEGLILPPQHGKRRGIFIKNGKKVKNGYDLTPIYNYFADPQKTKNTEQIKNDKNNVLKLYKKASALLKKIKALAVTFGFYT